MSENYVEWTEMLFLDMNQPANYCGIFIPNKGLSNHTGVSSVFHVGIGGHDHGMEWNNPRTISPTWTD